MVTPGKPAHFRERIKVGSAGKRVEGILTPKPSFLAVFGSISFAILGCLDPVLVSRYLHFEP